MQDPDANTAAKRPAHPDRRHIRHDPDPRPSGWWFFPAVLVALPIWVLIAHATITLFGG